MEKSGSNQTPLRIKSAQGNDYLYSRSIPAKIILLDNTCRLPLCLSKNQGSVLQKRWERFAQTKGAFLKKGNMDFQKQSLVFTKASNGFPIFLPWILKSQEDIFIFIQYFSVWHSLVFFVCPRFDHQN